MEVMRNKTTNPMSFMLYLPQSHFFAATPPNGRHPALTVSSAVESRCSPWSHGLLARADMSPEAPDPATRASHVRVPAAWVTSHSPVATTRIDARLNLHRSPGRRHKLNPVSL